MNGHRLGRTARHKETGMKLVNQDVSNILWGLKIAKSNLKKCTHLIQKEINIYMFLQGQVDSLQELLPCNFKSTLGVRKFPLDQFIQEEMDVHAIPRTGILH